MAVKAKHTLLRRNKIKFYTTSLYKQLGPIGWFAKTIIYIINKGLDR